VFSFPSQPVAYREPWAVPLAARLREFFASDTRVAYYHHRPDSSTFRYRCFNTSRALNRYVDATSASWFCQRDDDYYLDMVAEAASAVVICRAMYNSKLARFAQQCRRRGTPVLFDCDDYVFDPKVVPDILGSVSQTVALDREGTWTAWYGMVGRYQATLELTDAVIVTNDFLAERTREAVDLPVGVIPNFIGDDQLAYSQSLVQAKQNCGWARDDSCLIGYFSGSPSHARDFALVEDALAAVLEQYPGTRLRIVGYLDLSRTALARWSDRIDTLPFVNYLELQRLIAQTELNIAPLRQTVFTNAKSELKYFDAGIVQVPTIASPTYAMSRAITSGVNGVICADGDWRQAIGEVVADYDTLGRALAEQAWQHCQATYTEAAVADQIAAVLAALGSRVVDRG
jgi:glycosyltransferase involved in cell wall biosynthesis